MQKMAIQSPEKCGNLEVFSIKTLSPSTERVDFGATSWNIGSKCCIHYLLDWGVSTKRGGYFNLLLSVDESGTHLERLWFSFAGLFLNCDDVCQFDRFFG